MSNIKIFENHPVQSVWDEEKEEWFFSVADVISILTDSKDVKQYIKKMRSRDEELNLKWGTICTPVQMVAADGKKRKINASNTEGILRIIQSIPSKKAEPFKMWLAKVGRERIDEITDPELSINRAVETYRKKGNSEKWISQRLKSIEVRKDLTDEWNRSGVTQSQDYAILTNEITKAWSGKTVAEYKRHKNLKKENLRDNMTNMELVLNMLAEVTTTEISKSENPQGFEESKSVARRGGAVAGNARRDIEKQTGKSVISKSNAKEIGLIGSPEDAEPND